MAASESKSRKTRPVMATLWVGGGAVTTVTGGADVVGDGSSSPSGEAAASPSPGSAAPASPSAGVSVPATNVVEVVEDVVVVGSAGTVVVLVGGRERVSAHSGAGSRTPLLITVNNSERSSFTCCSMLSSRIVAVSTRSGRGFPQGFGGGLIHHFAAPLGHVVAGGKLPHPQVHLTAGRPQGQDRPGQRDGGHQYQAPYQ